MDTTSRAIQILQSRLLEIEMNNQKGKEEIERLYKEAIAKASAVRSKSLSKFKNDDDERMDILNALKTLGVKTVVNERQIPADYSPQLNFVKKTLYALAAIHSGDFEDVKTKLLELEPNINTKPLQNLNQCLSGLYNSGHIKKIKTKGRRYTYSIK